VNHVGCSYWSNRNPQRINYYSDDRLTDKARDRLGDAKHDNARVLNDRRFIYQDIGDESQACSGDASKRKGAKE